MQRILASEDRAQPSDDHYDRRTDRPDRCAEDRSVAAALLNPPYNFLAYREGLINLGFSGDFVRLPSTGIATLGETLERNPDQVRRLTRAIARARAFAKDNKAKVFPTLKRALRIEDEELLAKIYEQHKKVETADGRIDAKLMADTIHDARQTQGVTKEIPVQSGFRFFLLAGPALNSANQRFMTFKRFRPFQTPLVRSLFRHLENGLNCLNGLNRLEHLMTLI